jgi:hypothetical protein
LKTKDQLNRPAPGYNKHDKTDTLTVEVKINPKKHFCPLCCLEFCTVSPSHVEGEFTDATVYNNGSIIPVKPVTCDCCGLKVIS